MTTQNLPSPDKQAASSAPNVDEALQQFKFAQKEKWSNEDSIVSTDSFKVVEPSVYRKKLIISILAIIVILFSIGIDLYLYYSPCKMKKYEDVLETVPSDRPVCARLKTYLRFIVSSVSVKGIDSISSKWSDDAPHINEMKVNEKLSLLGENGFTVERLAIDKVKIFSLKCVANTDSKEIVFVEVVRKRERDKLLFRLNNVY